ncbi:MAG: 4-(cytidine 5'-diphospho)-2-C-methyl-D-erythritol kinase [Deltaproteobacteria bacterium]|nr:4-(cytidine 5'-diphospho)-2-C-methyl-D-erythritol kinase [Deltaproteobacteria bacterium]
MSDPGPSQSLSIASPCKVNLHLSIVGRRPDGFHEIETLFHRVSLQDSIHLQRTCAPGIHVSVSDPGIPSGPENLVWRAADLFLKHHPQIGGISLHIEKHIPSGAGLGGGSSNAAATLVGLQRLYGLTLSADHLRALGASLGADVAFFLADTRSAWATGIGEKLTPVDGSPLLWFLIVYPGIHISTQWAYRTFSQDIVLTNSSKNLKVSNSFRDLSDVCGLMYNDFEQVIFPRYGQIKILKEHLIAAGAAGALLSGSGSSVFGVFDTRAACEAARDSITGIESYRVFTVHSL